jgi:UDP-glucose 4-epimerase
MNAILGKKILVTGGAGLVGSATTDALLQSGAQEVRVLDNLVRGNMTNLESANRTGRLVMIEGDLRDRETTDAAVAGVDYIVHQAALRITRCAEAPAEATEVLVSGTANLLESAVRHGVKKLVAASSASVYGDPSYLPMDEAHPFNNRTLYGACKIANEQMYRAYNEMFHLPYVAFRYFNIYGPRMDIDGVYTEVMIRWMDAIESGRAPKIYGDGSQSMDFVFIDDVARANVAGLVCDVSDEVFNVGTGVQTTLQELCNLLLTITGSKLKPEYVPARRVNNVSARRADTRKAEKLLGFKSTVDLEHGLKRLLAWRQEAHAELMEVKEGAA